MRMRIFIKGEPMKKLEHPVREMNQVCIVQALRGGQRQPNGCSSWG